MSHQRRWRHKIESATNNIDWLMPIWRHKKCHFIITSQYEKCDQNRISKRDLKGVMAKRKIFLPSITTCQTISFFLLSYLPITLKRNNIIVLLPRKVPSQCSFKASFKARPVLSVSLHLIRNRPSSWSRKSSRSTPRNFRGNKTPPCITGGIRIVRCVQRYISYALSVRQSLLSPHAFSHQSYSSSSGNGGRRRSISRRMHWLDWRTNQERW